MRHLQHYFTILIIFFLGACGSDGDSSGGGYEGSISSPVNIGSRPVSAYSGTVGPAGNTGSGSFYVVTGTAPGGVYTVSLTNTTANLHLDVYDESSFDISTTLCVDFTDTAGDKICSTNDLSYTTTGTSLYIRVQNTTLDNASFSISVN